VHIATFLFGLRNIYDSIRHLALFLNHQGLHFKLECGNQLKSLITYLRGRGFKVIPTAYEDELNEGKNYKEFMK